jgi:4a-hydroxytetrahydrobiopterin dehydratase
MARTPPERLSDEEVRGRLEALPGWSFAAGKVAKTFKFKSFAAAFGWMSACAIVAERQDHHPEWKNVWATVEVELSTHEVGGVSERDFALARRMDDLARGFAG